MQVAQRARLGGLHRGLPPLPLRGPCVRPSYIRERRPWATHAGPSDPQLPSSSQRKGSDEESMPPDPEYNSLSSMDTAPPMLPTGSHPALPSRAGSNTGSSGASTSGSSPADGSQSPKGPRNPLARLLARIKLPVWLVTWWGMLFDKKLQHKSDPRAVRLVRLASITALFMCLTLGREAMAARTRVTTQEVLYSSFVKLLDSGRVRAARLEAGTSRLYFDLRPREVTAATEAVATSSTPSTAAVSTSAPAPAAGATAATATAATASVAPAAAATSSAPVRFQRHFLVKLADRNDPVLVSRILTAGVEFGVLKQSFTAALANVFMTALALWIPLMPLLFVLRRIMEERTGTRKKKAGDGRAASVAITFRDVAGVDSAKEELMEVVSVMRAQKSAYSKLKVKMPSGVLLSGPPGTGKTLLAKAVAGEAGVPFMAVSASEFVEMYVGRGAARIRELFAEARKAAPCVVFIDELDAVASRRGMGYNDERDQTLNQLLTELDGFEGREGVLLLAATNRIDVLDAAILRPGRISRKVVVPLPDEGGRRDILGVHLRGVPMVSDLDMADACERLARVTTGFSGAELANVVNEASLLAARKDADAVGMRELLEAVRRTKYGVNGGAGGKGNSLTDGLQAWLMDVASAPTDRKVKNAAA